MWNRLQRSLFLVICVVSGISPGALAEGEPIAKAQSQRIIRDIPSLNEVEQPLITVEGLLVQQPAPTPAQVTGVQLKPTDKGLEVILETAGTFDEVLNSETENTLITDIPNAQLRLPKGGAFRQDNLTQDIASVEVINLDSKTLRVTVTGKAGVPTAEVSQSPQALILSVVAPPAPASQPAPPVAPAPAPPPAEPQQPAAPETPAPAPQAESAPVELTVTAEEEAEGYFVPDTSVGNRTDTPLRDIPQSIQIVPQEVLRDQNVTRLDEAIRNVPGVTQFSPSSANDGALVSRGFVVGSYNSSNFLRNGLRDASGSAVIDFTNVERLEFLKDPASVFYGVGSPGGRINLVTKQPLSDPFYAIDATIGSYNFYRGAIDLSGPLNNSRTVLYRLNASYLNRSNFIDFYQQSGFSVAPTISLKLGEKTSLILEGDYSERRASPYAAAAGLPAIGTVLPNPNGKIPRNRYIGEPDDFHERSVGRVGYRLEHQFSDNWSFRNAFGASFEEVFRQDVSASSLDADNRTLERGRLVGRSPANAYSMTAEVIGKFSTGPVNHQLVFGTALSRFENSSRYRTGPAPSIDLFDPVYRQPRLPGTICCDSSLLTDTLGAYLQDQVALTENLRLVLGGQFDLFKQTNSDFLADTSTSQSGNAFSPSVGIVYQPVEPISLYANYSRSFTPTIGRAFDDSQFQPERATQYEVGVKADVNDRLLATLALYDLTRSGVLTEDRRPGVPRGEYQIQTGEQRSRGIELDIQGEILPGWNIIAGYAYTDAQLTEDNTLPVGNRLSLTPENAFNLWTTYEIQQGTFQGLGFGAGLFFVGDREGDLDNSFQLPSYLRTDAAVYYQRDRFRAALNFKNLFDINYFETAEGNLNVFYGEPFTVQGTISWEF